MQRYELSMGVLTVKTNQDWDRDFLICRDELLKTVNISLTVETKFWIFLVEIFKIKTFSVHAKIFVEIVKICWEKLGRGFFPTLYRHFSHCPPQFFAPHFLSRLSCTSLDLTFKAVQGFVLLERCKVLFYSGGFVLLERCKVFPLL
jgi:hypothetical protein